MCLSSSPGADRVSPNEVIIAFAKAYPPDAVKTMLWMVFKAYALQEGNAPGGSEADKQVVELFDSLVDLSGAVTKLAASLSSPGNAQL